MKKIILSSEQIRKLAYQNRYKVNAKNALISRCIDGRYPNDSMLSALAFPGTDAGELALVFAAANHYGFEVDLKKTIESFLGVIGGVLNFQLHSDTHADPTIPASGCGHIKQILLDPEAYFLEKKQVLQIQKELAVLKKNGAHETILEGDHKEGAVIQIKGNYGISPGYVFEDEMAQIFVYHTTLVNQRHRLLAKSLIEYKAVTLFSGYDHEYLYDALSEVAEDHLFETAKRLAAGLPLYQIEFGENGDFDVEELGII